MKKIYWRPHKVSRIELTLIAFVAIVGIFLVETITVREKQEYFSEKLEAARLWREGMQIVKSERLRRGYKIDPEVDPAESGIIGLLMSDVTTNSGHLPAKQTSINPNWAAVIVHMLMRAGVEKGDPVAVGVSGSFPAMNLAVFAALQVLEVDPIVIASVAGSQWGANIPKLLWIDMERMFNKEGLFDFHSIAASRGGVNDRALGLSKRGKKILDDSIEKNGLIFINEKDYEASLDRRIMIYEEYVGEEPIKAYINVGGGSVSVGTAVGKKAFRAGLNRNPPRGPHLVDSVMGRFAVSGVPVIHLVRIDSLAERFGLPLQPTSLPPVGAGDIYYKEEYSPWLPYAILGLIFLSMFAFIRMDWGFRIFRTTRTSSSRKPPEQMV